MRAIRTAIKKSTTYLMLHANQQMRISERFSRGKPPNQKPPNQKQLADSNQKPPNQKQLADSNSASFPQVKSYTLCVRSVICKTLLTIPSDLNCEQNIVSETRKLGVDRLESTNANEWNDLGKYTSPVLTSLLDGLQISSQAKQALNANSNKGTDSKYNYIHCCLILTSKCCLFIPYTGGTNKIRAQLWYWHSLQLFLSYRTVYIFYYLTIWYIFAIIISPFLLKLYIKARLVIFSVVLLIQAYITEIITSRRSICCKPLSIAAQRPSSDRDLITTEFAAYSFDIYSLEYKGVYPKLSCPKTKSPAGFEPGSGDCGRWVQLYLTTGLLTVLEIRYTYHQTRKSDKHELIPSIKLADQYMRSRSSVTLRQKTRAPKSTDNIDPAKTLVIKIIDIETAICSVGNITLLVAMSTSLCIHGNAVRIDKKPLPSISRKHSQEIWVDSQTNVCRSLPLYIFSGR